MVNNGKFKIIIGSMFLVSILNASVIAQDVPVIEPVVYSDQYLIVRSSIKNIEYETYHVGDILSLTVNLEFAPNQIHIVNLDESLLNQTWAELPGFFIHGEPRIDQDTSDVNKTMLTAVYEFQIVACSGGVEPPCPGGKIYPLPDLVIGIDLLGNDGRVISNNEINFRPWPGYIALASALPLREGALEPFTFYFPRRAYGLPVPLELNRYPAIFLLFAGLLTIGGTVLAPAARAWMRRRVPSRIGLLGSRWERIIDRLQDEHLTDEQFWEGVRVAITWYCYDEIDFDTLQWTENNEDLESPDNELERLKVIYMEAMNPQEANVERRSDVLEILTRLSEMD